MVAGVMASIFLPAKAQAQFHEGADMLGVGVGILGGYNAGWHGAGAHQSPALNLHYDHGMGKLGPGTWGLGGYLGFKTASYRAWHHQLVHLDYRYTYLVLGVRGTWHYNEWHGDSNLDTYAGLMLAYNSVTFRNRTDYNSYTYLDNYRYSGSGLGLGAYVGARYFLSDQIGVYGELGYGLTWLQAGLAIRL